MAEQEFIARICSCDHLTDAQLRAFLGCKPKESNNVSTVSTVNRIALNKQKICMTDDVLSSTWRISLHVVSHLSLHYFFSMFYEAAQLAVVHDHQRVRIILLKLSLEFSFAFYWYNAENIFHYI